ncbi:MAG: T9SS type A sorting domain-containing protein [Candidatus Cloacimonetes bacterium]|nr:T9SS type A sorting domain-containing protein [Candidatus Cloacimonadota bacterium]
MDSGTIDTTGLNLPEYDLAGNPRISGGRIDMGAYEWQDTHAVYDWQNQSTDNVLFQNYPNPFSKSTTISFNLNKLLNIPMIFYKQINLEIYNVRGQLVKTLFPLTTYHSHPTKSGQAFTTFEWDGSDENCNPLSSGVYFYHLKVGSRVVGSRKCLLLK